MNMNGSENADNVDKPEKAPTSGEDADFELTADMLVHEFDDETSLNEEDDDIEANQDELADLAKEGEMPIEDLYALYYGGNNNERESGDENADNPDGGDGENADGATKRNLRSMSAFTANISPDTDSSDEENTTLKLDDRKKPRVGEEYQVTQIPEVVNENTDDYNSADEQVWIPWKLPEDSVAEFLKEIAIHVTSLSRAEADTALYIQDNEDALLLLRQCNNDIEEALRRFKSRPPPLASSLQVWSEEECLQFETGLAEYGKDFYLIHVHYLMSKSVRDIVKFYYIWKKSERYDQFTAKTRLSKKKDLLPASVTDYMDRLLDETDIATSSDLFSFNRSFKYTTMAHNAALLEHLRQLEASNADESANVSSSNTPRASGSGSVDVLTPGISQSELLTQVGSSGGEFGIAESDINQVISELTQDFNNAHVALKFMDKISSPPTPCGATNGEMRDRGHEKSIMSLTAKDGLFIATECHLALLPDEDGDTALHLAAAQGDFEACKKLVELFGIAGKSIDVRNNLLQTPLHVAIITKKTDIVKLLVSNGSDPGNPDRFGSTAFHLCAKHDHHDCFVEILENARRPAALNLRDYEGQTALHVAVLHQSEKTFRLLIKHGADIDAKDSKGGRSPLIYSIEKNEKAFVEALLERDASVSQQTYSGDTALHIASGRGLQDIVRLLLRRGADATMKNTHFETPMSLATSPVLSDMMRSQYRTAFAEKKFVLADPHQTYMIRNHSNSLGPEFMQIGADNDRYLAKRSISLKMERPALESEGASASKRLRMMENPTSVNGSPGGLSNRIMVKNEYLDSAVEIMTTSSTTTVFDQTEKVNPEDDLESTKASDSLDDTVEIAMEEVEVSAEEDMVMRSDDEDKAENSPSPVVNHIAANTIEQPYTHKLMQYSINLNKAAGVNTKTQHQPEANGANVSVRTEPVQIVTTKLPRELMASLQERNPLSPTSISSPMPVKSKSVPNSPQPAEANLYQLAREGLAVAAMANSVNSPQGPSRDFGLTNYLKARPSRQAKIKSGTEELQNLALQGLAVAAMNGQSDILTTEEKARSVDDMEVKHHVTVDATPLSPNTSQTSCLPPPVLLRSNSMPPKPVHDASSYRTQQLATHMSSNRALLALAHANALKENVGQAVSAISMGKSQLNGTVKFPVQTPADISDSTKHNLRQAIMVKSTSPGVLGGETSRDKPDGVGKTGAAEKVNKSICLTFLPTPFRNAISTSVASRKEAPSTVANGLGRSKRSPDPVAVFSVTLPKNGHYKKTGVTGQKRTHEHNSVATTNSPVQKTIKDPTPTHTVAPLQIATNRSVSTTRPDPGQTRTAVSLATTYVTYRVPNSTPQKTTISDSVSEPAPVGSSISTSRVTSHCPGTSGATVSTMPVSVPLCIPQPQLLNQAALHVAQPSVQYVQPQIVYIPHGKDFIPVVLPPSALQPQLQYPGYAALAVHSQSSDMPKAEFLSSKLPPVDSNLLRQAAFPMQAHAQIGGLCQVPTQLYGAPQQLMQQQLMRDTYLYQQSLFAQGRLATARPVLAGAKPVAAVSAVPVDRTSDLNGKSTAAEEQPLNLSVKSERPDGERALNLMKPQESRGSVIRSVGVDKNENEWPPQEERSANHNSTASVHSLGQTPGVYLPPPVIINPSVVPTQVTNSAGIPAMTLPTIQYLNGVPFILGMSPQM